MFKVTITNQFYHKEINNGILEEFLLSILKDSKDTEFGQRFRFAEIKTREEFAESVPLSYYDLFKPYIDRIEELGEKNLLSSCSFSNQKKHNNSKK